MLNQITQLKQSTKFQQLPTWLQDKIEQLLQDLIIGGFDNWQPDHCVDFVTSLLLEDFNIQD